MFVTHLICSFTTGGAETMLVDIVNRQVAEGHRVTLIVINDLVEERLLRSLDKKVQVVRIGRKPGSRNPFLFLYLNIILFRLHADILHCHDCVIGGMLLPIFKKKLCLTVHTVGVSDKYFSCFEKIVAISDSVKQDITKRTLFCPEIIWNGIHIDRIKKRKSLEVSSPFRLIMVSRLDHLVKGQHVLLKALDLLVNKYKRPVSLDFVGEGKSEKYLRSLVEEYKLQANVNFLGLRDRNYIYTHLHEYDLFVQPSIYEGFGLTVVEAMIAGIPVLVSGDGPTEVVGQGKYGYCFEKENAEECAKKIDCIIQDYAGLDNFVYKASVYAGNQYSIQATVCAYQNLYESMTSDKAK
ncbi:glycosyltransferase [Parabacteroides provencensis]|uniref:glycosyltransferase n=1 Tax=Parabacteroides provencensis TaxID=1944636 RepID=UPI000C148389|nr:glycosyltransferase [Parabacteroides provencensis]